MIIRANTMSMIRINIVYFCLIKKFRIEKGINIVKNNLKKGQGMTVIAICSGKGGVGKTTISANLSVALSMLGKTVAIDGDIALPNLHTFFGFDEPFVTILDVLKDPSYLVEATYRVNHNLYMLPSSPSVKTLEEVKLDRFNEVVQTLRKSFSFIIIDVAAGLSKYAMIPMLSSDQVFLVVNPEKASILDAQKVKKIAEISGLETQGIIINRYTGQKETVRYAERMIGPIAGIIRESRLVSKCWSSGIPVVLKKPRSGIAKDFIALSLTLLGKNIPVKPYGKVKALVKRVVDWYA